MQDFISKTKILIKDAPLRKKVLFVILALLLFRVLAIIPIPGIDAAGLSQVLSNNQFLGLLNLFSGGGISNLSIVMLGVAPYITASIIMQLLTIMSPKIKALYHEEGESGRKKFAMYTRTLTVPLAIVQGFGLIALLGQYGIVHGLAGFELLTNILVITAGSILLMWIGELISEFGIGNGISIIIFAGIVASLPATLSQLVFSFDPAMIPEYLGFLVLAIVTIAAVVTVTEGERPIPITYAKQVRGGRTTGGVSTYLPLRVNQAGVIPIIFAISILVLPQMLGNFLTAASMPALQNTGEFLVTLFNNQILYVGVYFLLVFFFTYFYTAVTFDPDSIATNLQKGGAFIPGVRPGTATSDYISAVLSRITFFGALFLGVIAVLPIIIQGATSISSFAIGGTALLIVVSVALDILKKIDAQLSLREY